MVAMVNVYLFKYLFNLGQNPISKETIALASRYPKN